MSNNSWFSAVLLMAATSVSQAHHSPARFDQDDVVAIQATVVEFEWTNPHVYLTVRDGAGDEWLFEANATSILRRNGWSRDTLSAGDAVAIRANPNRNPEKKHGSLLAVTVPGGKSLSTRTGNQLTRDADVAVFATDLNGIWRGDPRAAFEFLFSTLDHPLTKKGEAARLAYDESMDPVASCVPWPTPRLMAWNAFYLIQVSVTDDIITFSSEFADTERIVYMDGREHPTNGARTNQGHSIGWWDDSTLVVDTALFADSRSPVADGIPSGGQKHVVERFTPAEDGAFVSVAIRVEDAEYLAEPFATEFKWFYSPHLDMHAFECDPDVARRFSQ